MRMLKYEDKKRIKTLLTDFKQGFELCPRTKRVDFSRMALANLVDRKRILTYLVFCPPQLSWQCFANIQILNYPEQFKQIGRWTVEAVSQLWWRLQLRKNRLLFVCLLPLLIQLIKKYFVAIVNIEKVFWPGSSNFLLISCSPSSA